MLVCASSVISSPHVNSLLLAMLTRGAPAWVGKDGGVAPELADRLKAKAGEAGFELREYAVRALTRFVSNASVSSVNTKAERWRR